MTSPPRVDDDRLLQTDNFTSAGWTGDGTARFTRPLTAPAPTLSTRVDRWEILSA